MTLARRKRLRHRSRRFRGFETLEARRVLATYFVDSTADNLTGTCIADTPGTGTCTLRSAIAAADVTPEADTIQIADGTYVIDPTFGSFDIGFVAGATYDDIAFVGNADPTAVIIDGDFQSRGFDIFDGSNSYSVSFQGLTIRNGIADDGSGGGGINASSGVNLTFENVNLESNQALDGSSGGALQASGNVTINNAVISGNFAERHGGGIDFGSFDDAKVLSISNTSISSNTSTLFGGGIYIDGDQSAAIIDTVSVTNNDGPDSGGGIYSNGAGITVLDSSFTGNSATLAQSGGGGLYIFGTSGTEPFRVSNTDFDNNDAVDGAGGLESFNAAGTIEGGTFTNNRVTGTGDTFDQGGGAIVVIGTADPSFDGLPVRIEGVTVRGNTAPAAGGIALVDATVSIVDSLIENNTSTSLIAGGGGIGGVNDTGDSFLTLQRSRVIGNTSNADAGGVGLIDVDINVFETTISNNNASLRAGGLGVLGNNDVPLLVIDSSTINNNSANNVGGGLGVISADVRMTNTTVTQNESLLSGGGIAYDNSNATVSSTISFSTIAENTAPGTGTNLLTQGTVPLTVSNSILALGDCLGSVQSGGFNIDGGSSCGLNESSDQSDTDPLLGPLADNGGIVLTRLLNAGSPAIDAAGDEVATDARGFFRPVDGDGNLTATSDIGAFEAGASEPTALVELLLQATDLQDNVLSPDAQGDLNLFVNQVFFLELGFQDLRTPPDQLGVAKYAADLQTSTNGALVPAVTATQFFTFDDALLGETVGTITFTNSGPQGQSTDVDVVDFLNDPTATTTAALVQIGFPAGKFFVSDPRQTSDGLVQSVRFDDEDFVLVNQPRIDVSVSNTSVSVGATTDLINPLLPDGGINPDAVPFILNTDSRTTGTNYFGTPTTGSFTEEDGLQNLGGVGSGGPPGDASSSFDAVSIPVLIVEPVQDLVLTAIPSLNATNGGRGSGPAGPQNTNNRLDVNGDLKVTSLDAIIVISQLSQGLDTSSRTDVNNDGVTTAIDALIIINELTERQFMGTEDLTTFISDDGDFILWHQDFALPPDLILSGQNAELTINAIAPTTSAPDLEAGSDTGVSDSDNITFVTTPRLTGTANPGATVEIFDRRLPVRRLTFDENTDFFPTWDPASETIAYVTELGVSDPSNSVSNIGLVESDASNERVGLDSVPEGFFGVGHSPSWVGSTGFVMINERVGAHTYATFDSSASPTTSFNSLLTIASGGDNIVVSRDGSTVLWRVSTSGGSGNVTIRTAPFASLAGQAAEAHGVALQTIASPAPQQYFTDSQGFALSPDGSQYVIAEPQNISGNTFSGFDLFLRSTADGALIQRLTTSGASLGAFNGQPAFSPDGLQVAFVRALGSLGVDDIYSINTDGSGLTNLTNTGPRVTERMPSYANDGDRLAFATPATDEAISPLFNEANNWNIYVIEGLMATQPPGALIGTTTADASGNWSIGVGVLAEGDHVLTARASLSGVSGPMSDALNLTVDTASPDFPSIPDLADSSDTGQSSNDDVTNDLTPTFEGTAIAGSTIELFADGVSIGQGVANEALYDSDDLIVVDQSAFVGGAVFAIDPQTGARTVVSSGQNFEFPTSLAFDSSGSLYVTDSLAQAVFAIDPFTGDQSILASGGLLQEPTDIVVDAFGNLLVTDAATATVVQIDPFTGNQSAFASGGNLVPSGLRGIALDGAGNLLVTDTVANAVIRIDPITKLQTVVSVGDNLVDPVSVSVDSSGLIYVVDPSAFGFTGGVLQIDPFTGAQTTLSSGGSFQGPSDVFVDELGDLIVIDQFARTLFRVDPMTQNVIALGGDFLSPVGVTTPVLPLSAWSVTSRDLGPGDFEITALATDVAGNVSGRTTIKHLEFNIDGVLPSDEPDIEHFNDTGSQESATFVTDGGFLEQQTFGIDGSASYRFPTVNRTNGGLSSSEGLVQEARLQVSEIEGTAGVNLSLFDGANQYAASLTSAGVNVVSTSGTEFVAVDVFQPHTYRLESPGNSNLVNLFVDDVLVLTTTAPALALNGFEFGDASATTGNGANASYDYVRVAQQDSAIGLNVTLQQPKLIIQDVVVDESAGVAEIAVTLDSDAVSAFTVEFSTIDDQAIDGDNSNPGENDYGAFSDVLSFDGFSGEVQLITIQIEDDDVVEDIEQFTIELSNLLPDTLNIDISDIGTVNIVDNDSATVSVSQALVLEDTGMLDVVLTFSGQSQDPVDFFLESFDNGDAESGVDYTDVFETVEFEGIDGETQTVSIPITVDDIVELNEQFLVTTQFDSPDRRNIRFEGFADSVSFDPDGGFSTGFDANAVEIFVTDSSTTIAYIGDADGLRIVDFSEPQTPVELGVFAIAGGVQEIDRPTALTFDGLLYVAAGSSGLVVLDVQDPANIQQVGSFAVVGQVAQSLVRDGNTVYLGEADPVNLTDGGMRILDVSNPNSIAQIGFFTGLAGVEDIALQGTTAYLAVSDTNGNFLQTVDVLDPTNPLPIGSFATREATAIAVNGPTAFLGTTNGLATLDVSDPANILELDFFSTSTRITTLENQGSILAVGDDVGTFGFFDATFPQSIQSLGLTSSGATPVRGIANDGFNYFLANSISGVSVFEVITFDDTFATIFNDDVATLSIDSLSVNEDAGTADVTVRLTGDVDVELFVDLQTEDIFEAIDGEDFTGDNDTLNFSGFDGETQSFLVDIIDDDVTELNEFFSILASNINASGRDVRFDSAGNVFASLQDIVSGVPANSIFSSASVTLNEAGDIAYLADAGGLRIYDVSNPASIIELGSFDAGVVGMGEEVVVDGDVVYLAAGFAGLFALDVSDPTNVQPLDNVPNPSRSANSVQKIGDLVYLGAELSGSGRVSVYDASNPLDLTLLGEFTTPVSDLSVVGNTAYVAAEDDGLRLLDVTDPAAITEISVFDLIPSFEVVTVVEDVAYVGTSGATFLIDVLNPLALRPIGLASGIGATGIDVATDLYGKNLLTITDSNQSLRFFDAFTPDELRSITDGLPPGNFPGLQTVGFVDLGIFPADIDRAGTTLYVSDRDGGFQSFELLLSATADVEIVNDDSAQLSIDDVSQPEDNGSMTFTVTLSGDVDTTIDVDFATSDLVGQAVGGVDYTAVSDSLVFSGFDGETQTITVPITADSDIEPDETFVVDLFNLFAEGRDVSIDPDFAIGTIENDDLVAGADLSISKSDDADPVFPDETLTYTLVVTNDGPDPATGVTVTDLLPGDVSFLIGDVNGDESAVTNNGGDVTALVGNLAVGSSATITIVTQVADTAAGDLTNTASVSGNESDGVPGNNTASESTTVGVVIVDDEVTINEDDPTTLIDVLDNDLPLGGLTIVNVTAASLGTAIIDGGTAISYTPNADVFGTDIFTYTATNAFGETDSAEVTININPINDPPEANDDTVDAGDRTSPLLIDVATLLSNDTPGPNEDAIQSVSLTDVDLVSSNGGSVSLSGNTITYTPPAGFNGLTDTFTYTISDDFNPPLSDSATVTINLPPPPATLIGHVFCDANGDGSEGPGEAVVGTLVFLDENENRRFDVGERSTTTDSNGDYVFTNITDSMLTVVAQVPDGCRSIPSNPGIARSQVGIQDLAHSLVATDLDQDGDQDLVVVGDLINDQATFLENIDGSFSVTGVTPLGDRPRDIAAWNDGTVPFMAVAGVGTTEDAGTVYLMSGTSVVGTVKTGDGPVDVAVTDFDGNNEPDVLVAALRTSDVYLILNGVEQLDPIAETRLARAVEAGDVDGDGNADAVIGGFSYPDDESSQLAVLLGDGLGGFADPLEADPIRRLVGLNIAPLDQATDNNVVWALSESGSLAVYDIEDGILNVIDITEIAPGATSMDVGDFNRDGKTDVAIASLGNQRVDIYIGDGDGQFTLITSLDQVSAPSDVVVADFDQDGADDVAVTNLYQDANSGQGSPDFELPSTVTILLVDVAEAGVVITSGTVAEVDFEFQNADPEIRFDVSGEGDVTPLDALRVVNRLQNGQAEGEAAGRREATDVNGDGRTTAVDALMIINYLGRKDALDGSVDLLADDDDEDEDDRISAIDVVFGQLV